MQEGEIMNYINEISAVTDTELERILEIEAKKPRIFIGKINGEALQHENEVFTKIGKAFKFTDFQLSYNTNYSAFYDWMTDLYYLTPEFDSFILIIENSNGMLKGNLKKQGVLKDYLRDIINFWTDEVETVVVGGATRNFTVFLVNDELHAKKHKFFGLF